MKISLRKADAIQRSINEAISGIDLKTEVTLNEFERPTDKINAAKEGFDAALAKRDSLLDVLYEVRYKTGLENTNSGVSMRLAQLARLEKDIAQYKRLASVAPVASQEVLLGKLGKMKSRDTESYRGFGNDEIVSSILDAETIDGFKVKLSSLKKDKQRLQDELLEVNVKAYVELSEKAVNTLQLVGIL
jgi:hypothetical protein